VKIDIIFLVETCKHKESKVPNIEGFSLWSYVTRDPTIEGLEAYIVT
jgi:hypothetical protein